MTYIKCLYCRSCLKLRVPAMLLLLAVTKMAMEYPPTASLRRSNKTAYSYSKNATNAQLTCKAEVRLELNSSHRTVSYRSPYHLIGGSSG
jgi:hypothetical protein